MAATELQRNGASAQTARTLGWEIASKGFDQTVADHAKAAASEQHLAEMTQILNGGLGAISAGGNMLGNGTVEDASIRTGAFSLNGANGSSILLYSGAETGRKVASDLADAGRPLYNKTANGSALNLSINIDNAGNASPKDYIASLVGDRKYDNVIFNYHGDENGLADERVQALFGPKSDIHSVLTQHTTGSGVVMYTACYGVASGYGTQSQSIADRYRMNVLTASFGLVITSPYELTPTIPHPTYPGSFTPNGGYWNVTKPKPENP